LTQALPYKPDSPIKDPIELVMRCYMPIPKTTSKKKRALMLEGEIKHTKRPDFDNMIKIIDALNGIFWIDDSQIYSMQFRKSYSDIPRTELEIAWVEPNIE